MTEEKTTQLATTEQSLRPRPFWQRVIYPIIGGILVIIGLVGWIMPIMPGFPLIIIGIPLLFCFNARLELWVRREMHRLWHLAKAKVVRHRPQ